MEFQPIGTISSPFKQKFATPRQASLAPSAEAIITLDKSRVPQGSLDSLNGYSHIWLIFCFHKSPQLFAQGKVSPPRLNGEKIGVFATRSPHRPNNIGLSLVQLLEVDEKNNQVTVSGTDLIDGTPILDIKPYINGYDSIPESSDGWTKILDSNPLEVQWSDQALENIKAFNINPKTINVVKESLRFDLRNLEDKKKNDLNKIFKSHIETYDFHFKYSQESVMVIDIQKIRS